jgi:hypothetical protein
VRWLRLNGHQVYDFRNPPTASGAFSWSEIDDSLPVGPADLQLPASEIINLLGHPRAADGFASDMGALRSCDACVLVLPSGRSAHLEAGWAVGAGKFTIGLLADGEPELMWKMLDVLCHEPIQVVAALDAWRSAGESLKELCDADPRP